MKYYCKIQSCDNFKGADTSEVHFFLVKFDILN